MAAPPPGGAGRGNLGWLILAAALAVPGFLFYNWSSRLKSEHDRGVSAKARTRAEGGVFQTAPVGGRLVNPMAPSTSAPAGFPPRPAGDPRPKQAVAAVPAPAAPVPAPSAAARPSPLPAATAAVPAPAPAPTEAAPEAVAASSSAAVVLPRDPMMSPLDLVRIQEAQIEAAARAQALLDEEARRRNRRHAAPPKPKPIETKIELQGIVAGPTGENLAIINGLTVNTGEKFAVEGYAGKVAVRKITATDVTLEYSGRKFKLTMNAE
jgi:hypothetical protein